MTSAQAAQLPKKNFLYGENETINDIMFSFRSYKAQSVKQAEQSLGVLLITHRTESTRRVALLEFLDDDPIRAAAFLSRTKEDDTLVNTHGENIRNMMTFYPIAPNQRAETFYDLARKIKDRQG